MNITSCQGRYVVGAIAATAMFAGGLAIALGIEGTIHLVPASAKIIATTKLTLALQQCLPLSVRKTEGGCQDLQASWYSTGGNLTASGAAEVFSSKVPGNFTVYAKYAGITYSSKIDVLIL